MRLLTFILIYLFGPVLLPGCSRCLAYVMPDGARCEYMASNYGHVRFTGCNNGKAYQDPATWTEANVCK